MIQTKKEPTTGRVSSRFFFYLLLTPLYTSIFVEIVNGFEKYFLNLCLEQMAALE